MSVHQVFLLPPQLDSAQLLLRIGELYTLQEIGEESAESLFMDTFDWRLFHKGCVLSRKGYHYKLAWATGTELYSGSGSRKKHPFWYDFEEKELQDRLQQVADIRALIPQFLVSTTKTFWGLQNKDQKTVLRMTMVTSTGHRSEQAYELEPVLLVESLKGYKKPHKRVCELLEGAGLKGYDGAYNLISHLHALASIDPHENDSKFVVNLHQQDTVAQAVKDICLNLRAAMLRNFPGTLDDIDSEFLHDFRVSIRRTRSLLSLMKKWLPTEEVAYFQGEFKWLGTVTGPVRDLDVYLLKTDEYRSMLPEELHPGLEWFVQTLRRQRKREIRLLREHLNLARFADLAASWEQFLLHLPERNDSPKGKLICHEVAEKIIRKRFKRLLRNGGAITPATPDEKLHELRIEGKKFRYILEFFRSVFQGEAVDAYLVQMKKLQNNLGDFNDLSVQKDVLVQRLAGLRAGNTHAVETAAALGGLIVHLGDQQDQVRRKFQRTFQDFATRRNIELLQSVFTDADAASGEESEAT